MRIRIFLLGMLILSGCFLFHGESKPEKPDNKLNDRLIDLAYRVDIILDGEKATRVSVLEITNRDGTISNLGRYLSDDLIDRLNDKKRPATAGYPARDTLGTAPAGKTVVISGTLEDTKAAYVIRLTFTDPDKNYRLGSVDFELPDDPSLRLLDAGMGVANADSVLVQAGDPRFNGNWILCRSEHGVARRMKMTLEQTRNVVSGQFEWFGGRINGKVDGNKMTVQWYQVENQLSGTGYFIMDKSGTRMKGFWGTDSKRTPYKWEAVRTE
jgi:hypothetical protein